MADTTEAKVVEIKFDPKSVLEPAIVRRILITEGLRRRKKEQHDDDIRS